ncbi:MAG: hypothetical protein EBR79_00560 [Proteobacteria bacterium]|nr:hypothetical protein [Pseudomonadota bacterium]
MFLGTVISALVIGFFWLHQPEVPIQTAQFLAWSFTLSRWWDVLIVPITLYPVFWMLSDFFGMFDELPSSGPKNSKEFVFGVMMAIFILPFIILGAVVFMSISRN